MTAWEWLAKPRVAYTWRFAAGVIVKGLLLFAVLNVVFALLDPMAAIGRLSVYNILVPGRPRLPYGENPADSYNLSLPNLNALFAAHEINGAAKAPDEYRVIFIGDSALWGVLLNPDQTVTAYLNAARLRMPNGKRLVAYNLGYPVQSLFKDLLILQHALSYQPDLIVWLFTPESFAPDQQVATQIVRENPATARELIAQYGLKVDPNDSHFMDPDFFGRTIIGRRRALADWLRLQLYGLTWGITRYDQRYPRFFEPRMEDFPPEMTESRDWHGFAQGSLKADSLSFDMLRAGVALAARDSVPVLLVHEPMFISGGKGSDVRYNAFYPRWVVDSFRDLLTAQASANNWQLMLDLWNFVPREEFTDSAVHLTPFGSQRLAGALGAAIQQLAQGVPLSAQNTGY